MKIAVCDDDLIFQRKIKEELDQYYQSLDVLVEIFSSGRISFVPQPQIPTAFSAFFWILKCPA